MKKILIIAGLVATGLAAQAQTLVLSDSFDTGGVATNNMLYNLGARQAGTAAPNNLNTVVSNTALLTAAGELHLTNGAVVHTDHFSPQIGNQSFSIEVAGRHDAASANWTTLAVLADGNPDWNASPMSAIIYHNDWIWLRYGTAANAIGGASALFVGLSPTAISAALGTTYSKADQHTFEIRATALSSTNGLWNFYIDGIALAAGLPYQFEDANLRMSWWGGGGGADSTWSDWSISTFTAPAKEYVFFDDFNADDSTDANAGYISRQTNGFVTSLYNNPNPASLIITNSTLNDVVKAGSMNLIADFGEYIVGQDFEFSVKLANKETGTGWGSIYITEEGGGRGGSRLGCLAWGAAQGTAFTLYSGLGVDADLTGYGVSVAALAAALGGWNTADEHTLQFISHPGSGGSNTYDFVVDGATMVSGIPYRFPGPTRTIGWSGVPVGLGIVYDDLYLKVLKGISYEDWVVDDTTLTVGVNDARADDPDDDTMDNLLEYALGGNPMVDDAGAYLPTSEFAADTIEYVYRRRVDASTRGLAYGLTVNTGGLQLPWTNYGTTFETNAVPLDFAFESVTNVLPITGLDLGFVNLEVTEQ